METIVQAGWEGLRIVGVDVAVNSATRPSRLVKSIPRYILRSAQTILRSFALYKPLRFFLALGLLPLLISLALLLRWFYTQLLTEEQASRVPSLVGAAMMFLLAVLIWMFGFLADLLSVNRRILSDSRVILRTQELERLAPRSTTAPANMSSERTGTVHTPMPTDER
jgi:hypothetical protein